MATHVAAEEACVKESANLASINSEDEQKFVHDHWIRSNVGRIPDSDVPNFNPRNALWIGAKRNDAGIWSWTDDSTWGYTNWASTEPNFHGNCGHMWTWHGANGKWGDEACDTPTRYSTYFMCEKPESGYGR
ncbi:asialoglycoprotein receptor 2-like [Amphiura filiformis]|uniref:asialoglycoprotein receptor 2-like n=1 Tax=Amphiura filiformis TaxID=82378 RepID=UPI003B22445A